MQSPGGDKPGEMKLCEASQSDLCFKLRQVPIEVGLLEQLRTKNQSYVLRRETGQKRERERVTERCVHTRRRPTYGRTDRQTDRQKDE